MSVLFAGQHQGFCNPWMLAKSHMLPELYPSTGGGGRALCPCYQEGIPGLFVFFSANHLKVNPNLQMPKAA